MVYDLLGLSTNLSSKNRFGVSVKYPLAALLLWKWAMLLGMLAAPCTMGFCLLDPLANRAPFVPLRLQSVGGGRPCWPRWPCCNRDEDDAVHGQNLPHVHHPLDECSLSPSLSATKGHCHRQPNCLKASPVELPWWPGKHFLEWSHTHWRNHL